MRSRKEVETKKGVPLSLFASFSSLFTSLSFSLSPPSLRPHRQRLRKLVALGSFAAGFFLGRRRPLLPRGSGDPSGEEEDGGMVRVEKGRKKGGREEK